MSLNVVPVDLSEEQLRFAKMLERCPSLTGYWDFKKRECDIPALEKRMRSASHGERILAQFFLDIWLNDGANRMDLIEAATVLDSGSFAIVREWVADPFLP